MGRWNAHNTLPKLAVLGAVARGVDGVGEGVEVGGVCRTRRRILIYTIRNQPIFESLGEKNV